MGLGFYELISELIDSDIVVDIISGTSAGGVNGVKLAYALANKKELNPSRSGAVPIAAKDAESR
jgi:predicted acylesterase/phospholipase RssA